MSNLIQWIEIENYKCFEHLRVEGLKRVNLIGGDNNVGKTAFLGAGYINIRSSNYLSFCYSFEDVFLYRDFINLMERDRLGNSYSYQKNKMSVFEDFNIFNIETNLRKVNLKIELDNIEKILEIEIDENKKKIREKEYKDISLDDFFKNINFLPSFGTTDFKLMRLFSYIQKNRKRNELNSFINSFDSNIEEFDIINDTPSCFVKDRGEFIALSEFGDGLGRFISIICAIWGSENGTLFIDEVENGIHYTKLDKLFEIIFVTAKKLNTQIFLTTHSKEAIEAFNRVQFDFDESDSCYLEFMKGKKSGKISVWNRDREELDYSLKNRERLRGE